MSTGYRFLKSIFSVSCMTLLSRILGFIRDIIIANIFGAGAGVDAYVIANKIPAIFRSFLAEGAFSQAFVPIMTEKKELHPDQAREFLCKVIGNLSLVLSLIIFIGLIITPVFVYILAPGFSYTDDAYRFNLTTGLSRITFFYLFFASLTAIMGSVLNSYGKFAVPAFTPVLLNLAIIGSSYLLASLLSKPEYALAVGVVIGGFLQFSFQLPFLKKIKMLAKPQISWSDPGVKKLLVLLVPALFGASVVQISSMVSSIFASFLSPGVISWMYFSERLISFPLGLFAVGIATVALPNLSKSYTLKNRGEFDRTLDWSIRTILMISIPAMLGFYLLARPIIATLFLSGEFTNQDVIATSNLLAISSFSLISIMLNKILSSAFYARKNIKTPVIISAVSLIVNIILNSIFIQYFSYLGLALSVVFSSMFNTLLLIWFMFRENIFTPQPGWNKFILQLLIASAMMVLILLNIDLGIADWSITNKMKKISYLVPLITVGFLTYVISLYITGIRITNFKLKEN